MGDLSLGKTGDLHPTQVSKPPGPTGVGKLAGSDPGVAPAWGMDRAGAQELGQSRFTPAQVSFGEALKQAAQAQGIKLLERLLDAEPEEWPVILEKSTPQERQQAIDFLAEQKGEFSHGGYLDFFSELLMTQSMLSGPDAVRQFGEILDEMEKRWQKLLDQMMGA